MLRSLLIPSGANESIRVQTCFDSFTTSIPVVSVQIMVKKCSSRGTVQRKEVRRANLSVYLAFSALVLRDSVYTYQI
jgi:hypothetical protein